MRFLGVYFFTFLTLLVAGGILYLSAGARTDFRREIERPSGQISTSSVPGIASSTPLRAASTTATSTIKKVATAPKKPSVEAPETAEEASLPPADPNMATRINDPYPFPPLPAETINEKAREALVNIFCVPSGGSMRPTSGSGIIIDPRGVILTNAHVAQYVLLSQSQNIDLSCTIRSGSPAAPKWRAEVMYLPPVWVQEHVQEIKSQRAYGTGEHDYALLLITQPLEGLPPAAYPYLPIDTRHAIGFEGDPVLVASYPAELIGGFAAQNSLYAISSHTTIQKLLTFVAQTIDLISLGGVIGAQSGSSGGAAVNAWGRLVGLVVTTSAGDTTGERDLRALTLSYIDRDLAVQTGHNLTEILSADVNILTSDFRQKTVPTLIKKYIDTLTGSSQ